MQPGRGWNRGRRRKRRMRTRKRIKSRSKIKSRMGRVCEIRLLRPFGTAENMSAILLGPAVETAGCIPGPLRGEGGCSF